MQLIPAGPPDDPTALLKGTLDASGIKLALTAIRMNGKPPEVGHPNCKQLLNDVYNIAVPTASVTYEGNAYVVVGVSTA